jgi:hypothetical protein
MTLSKRQRRNAVALLIAVGERNDDVMRGLEAERVCLLTLGSLIPSPVWRRRGPVPMQPGAASPDCGRSGHSMRHGLGRRVGRGRDSADVLGAGPAVAPVRPGSGFRAEWDGGTGMIDALGDEDDPGRPGLSASGRQPLGVAR